MRRAADYRKAATGFASGTERGLTDWLMLLSSRALQAGAREARVDRGCQRSSRQAEPDNNMKRAATRTFRLAAR